MARSFIRFTGCIIIITLLFFPVSLFAQIDFNYYTTLTAHGSVPEDFTTPTANKIAHSIANRPAGMSASHAHVFYEGIHVSIDELLQSGTVVYGDEISMYVNRIADRLLEPYPELKGQLRFYTIKSNEANALSTDQGIIFITTGLIAQLSSEAQLAYILSHEIVHFTEKHIKETFTWKTQSPYQRRSISELNQYSRENELEADKLALKYYHAAGYSKDEIIPTFDVLMYSHLPFEDLAMTADYFRTEKLYIPESYFSSKSYPIKTNEDYNDQRSSHPNIRKRKDAAGEYASDYANWGKTTSFFGDSTFRYIRQIARFETVRTDIIDGQFAHALYSIFLLERTDPSSVWLKRMKAISWLGLAQFREKSKQTSAIPENASYEGESAFLYAFLKKLNQDAMLTMAIRNVWDLRRAAANDPVLDAIYDRLAKTLAETAHFSWNNYSSNDFQYSASRALAKKNTDDTQSEVGKSKYDKIKTRKLNDAIENFDSTHFYFYGITDILADSLLREKYNTYRTAYQLAGKTTLKTEQNAQLTIATPATPMGMKNCILVEPGATYYSRGRSQWKGAMKHQEYMKQGFLSAANLEGVETTFIDRTGLETGGTTLFNERLMLFSLLGQTASCEDTDFFPVDYEVLQQLTRQYGTSHVLFTASEYGLKANMSTLVVDTKGGIQSAVVYNYRGTLSRSRCMTHYRGLLHQLKTEPNGTH